jgi:Methylase involved in ubiquinone/menaquinone biosynthesis
MYKHHIDLLRCPHTGAALKLDKADSCAEDGEILEGVLSTGLHTYQIRNGIPRFVDDISYNDSWDYKWRVLDGGHAYNYRILDKTDPAYQIHDIFDRNDHGGLAFKAATGRVVLDIGCGIGQYTVKLLEEYQPATVVAMDLTSGVDVFRQILSERYSHLKTKVLIVQASVFQPPFVKESFDFVMSLGVLMHTGNTLKALDNACSLVKNFGELNVWIYCSEPLAYDAVEPGREGVLTMSNVVRFIRRWRGPMFFIHLFRKLDAKWTLRVLRFMSSGFIFRLSRKRGFRWIDRIFPSVDHPDSGYRLINHFDGYVNNWCDTWSEHEIFPTLRDNSIAIMGMSKWRLGIWGRKLPKFYGD